MSNVGLNTGLRALLSARYMLDTIGHNIANANTPGYSRQRIDLSSAMPVQLGQLLIGTGVDAGAVQRSVDDLLNRRINGQQSLMGSLTSQRAGLSDIEALLAEPGDTGLGSLMDGFFGSLSQLSTSPSDPILRTSAVQATDALTARFRELSQALKQNAGDATADIATRVNEVNELAQNVSELNLKIGETETAGVKANDLRDQRDAALERLSELVDTTVAEGPNGSVRVMVSGNTLVGATHANALSLVSDTSGRPALKIKGSNGFLPVQGGEIGGLVRLNAEIAPDYQRRLDQLAHNLILEVNRVHTTGMAAGGPFTTLTGASALTDFDQDGKVNDELLSNAGLPFDVSSGSLFVNVTDSATGAVEQRRIDISQSHTTVQDFVDQLNALEHLSAAVDATGHLRVSAETGYGFDFSRRVDKNPDPAGIFGGARATLGTSGAEPFALADGDTLDLTVNTGGAPVSFSIAFAAADFAEISSATADEIAAAVNANPAVQANGMHASAVDGHLFLQTLSEGTDAQFTITGGTSVAALGWSSTVGTTIQGQANAVDVRLSGVYGGDADERFVFKPTMDGTIGTTEGLQIDVFDRAGNRVTTLDVGAGYAPGTELEVADGVKASFGLGEISASQGDTLAFDAVADSDSADVLVALGLNTLLAGKDASDIAVRADILDDPSQLALSLTGDAGDGSLLGALADVQKTHASGLDGTTVGNFWNGIVGDVGFAGALTDGAIGSNQAVLDSLQQRQASISGVNVDEELVDLTKYEQAFQAAAQYITVVNQIGDDILHLF